MKDMIVHILLAEDNDGDILLTSELIEESPYQCPLTVVKDGAAAVDYLFKKGPYKNAQVPDVIFLDINMPKRSGLEVLKAVKNDPKLMHIPTAILTTSSSTKDKMDAQKLSADFYFTKPLEVIDLEKVIKSIRK
ncbi:response regulator [Arthrospiribacter ruber]|uniref:Response regulator n=1 Tax=Arthrospiribacter ruber TaxID=2487934 RepID=A0A951IX07_9BACT|nr:response regulator [Arthrospiribacter ruber]MBW3468650.1 response regulator [Arthrospiribacter ruber]